MDDHSMSLSEFLATIKRRKWFFLLPLLTVLGLAVAIAYSLPAVYRSTGTILIEQQGLPSDLVPSTISSYADERIAVIRKRVMTASNLLSIMDVHGLYPELRNPQDETAALEQMRRDVTVEIETSDTVDPRTGRPASVTISFTISFDANAPDVAQAVAAKLVDLFLAENQRERQETTQQASLFLEQESARLADNIAELEEQLAIFKTESGTSLPDMMRTNLDAMERLNDRLRSIDESISALTESSILLEGELARTDPYQRTASLDWGGERVLAPADQLKALEAQSVALSARYSPEHPDRIKVERELQALRAALKNSDPGQSVPDADNPAYIQLRSRIIANETELNALKASRSEQEALLAEYERRVAEAPSVEQEYLALTRDYESAVDRYRDVRSKLGEAKLAEALETQSKGERFTLIDPPRLSEVPIKPNRPALLFLGLVLAVGSGIGTVALRQAVDQGIYGARALAKIAGAPPLAVIPFIDTAFERTRRRRRLIGILGVIGAIILLGVFASLTGTPVGLLSGQ